MSTTMNPEVKAMWVEALRSGEYQQQAAALRVDNGDEILGYCCLGVLCDLAVKSGVGVHVSKSSDGEVRYDERSDFPPSSVLAWAGLAEENPKVTHPDGTLDALSVLNDSEHSRYDDEDEDMLRRFTFTDIATLIETSL